MLHLDRDQEGSFKGTKASRAIPFDGVVLAHSDEIQWKRPSATTEQQKRSGSGLHRQGAVLLRVSEEIRIYEN